MVSANDTLNTPPPADRRKTLRSPLIIRNVKLEDERRSFFGYARNISHSGIYIPTANPREPGSRHRIEIPLPPPLSQTVNCTCEVVWQRQFTRKSPYEPGMGLRFLDLPEDQSAAIARWIESGER